MAQDHPLLQTIPTKKTNLEVHLKIVCELMRLVNVFSGNQQQATSMNIMKLLNEIKSCLSNKTQPPDVVYHQQRLAPEINTAAKSILDVEKADTKWRQHNAMDCPAIRARLTDQSFIIRAAKRHEFIEKFR